MVRFLRPSLFPLDLSKRKNRLVAQPAEQRPFKPRGGGSNPSGPTNDDHWPVAQLAERLTLNQKVEGSNPSGPSIAGQELAMQTLVNVMRVWECGRMGVWEQKNLPHTQTPILPHRMETPARDQKLGDLPNYAWLRHTLARSSAEQSIWLRTRGTGVRIPPSQRFFTPPWADTFNLASYRDRSGPRRD